MSWKNPVVRHAVRTWSTTFNASVEVGERRYGRMSTMGIMNLESEGGLVETVILIANSLVLVDDFWKLDM